MGLPLQRDIRPSNIFLSGRVNPLHHGGPTTAPTHKKLFFYLDPKSGSAVAITKNVMNVHGIMSISGFQRPAWTLPNIEFWTLNQTSSSVPYNRMSLKNW